MGVEKPMLGFLGGAVIGFSSEEFAGAATTALGYILGGSLLLVGSLYYCLRDVSNIKTFDRVTIDKNRMDLAGVIAIALCAIFAVSLFFVSYPKHIANLLLALAGIGGLPLIIARFVYPTGDRLIDRFF